ncbi:hypothetical protein HMPREF0872_03990 [Veillonella montpellierensis DNF00314]|uniref:Uncharacterized protein n=1 Tax=Veillonella montpellierensis DNF00314 TaxID=1401067 RepID=A0A096AKD0_9FIRM|nr:hypothetical protein [Veillonella montpellierensis]KGF47563.1 hypothetical protein HMPREF0872_03990 [Veillonella montpellierensis DNF00314]
MDITFYSKLFELVLGIIGTVYVLFSVFFIPRFYDFFFVRPKAPFIEDFGYALLESILLFPLLYCCVKVVTYAFNN